MLHLYREAAWFGPMVGQQVRIDGQVVGWLHSRQTLDLEIPTGTHRLEVGGRLFHSRAVLLEGEVDTNCEYRCAPALRGWVLSW